MTTAGTVLVVDDSPETGAVICEALVGTPWRVETVASLQTAEVSIDQRPYDVVMTGLRTSPAEDLKTLRRIRRRHPRLKMIVLAVERQPDVVLDALREHAFSYFSPPFSIHDIREMLARAVCAPDWDDGIEVISDRPDWITVRASCQMLTAERLLRFLDELALDLSEDDRTSMGAAFREILLNAVEHGGRFDPETRVEITRIRASGLIMYLVRDPGEGFDLEALPHAAISNPDDPVRHALYREQQGMRPGGLGLLVARGMVDELLHNAKGNEVVLIKYVT